MNWQEVNFDGLIGPTHNYAGLSFGNVASSSNRQSVSTPRDAARQGLEKMRTVLQAGIPQAILPPQPRPDFSMLRQLGFRGTEEELIQLAADTNPVLLSACYSASSMWTANAATVSPSPDCADGRIHFTPANLISTLHRSIETDQTQRVFEFLVGDERLFSVHDPLPPSAVLSDEGAANHTRLCGEPDGVGLELFVYGRDALEEGSANTGPQKFPARQTLQASQAVARNHLLDDNCCFFLQQSPQAIDAGAFHNDVVAVGHRHVFLFHELAFANAKEQLARLRERFQSTCDAELQCIEISSDMLSLSDAVQTYLFNSQILSRPDGGMFLLCPNDCLENDSAKNCLEFIVSGDNPIESYTCLDLKQSMMNGGGPACLRLRLLMNDDQLSSIHQGVMLNESLIDQLQCWVDKHYREQIAPQDLCDPGLAKESAEALSELEQLLNMPEGLLGYSP